MTAENAKDAKDRKPICEHNFIFLRQENREMIPGQWHSDREIFDVYYCSKCLIYKDVSIKIVKT